MDCVTSWQIISATSAQLCDFPPEMSLVLQKMLINRGIRRLYSHQAQAFMAAAVTR